jgi:hypothetical protein
MPESNYIFKIKVLHRFLARLMELKLFELNTLVINIIISIFKGC